MLILSLDTTTSFGSVALLRGTELLSEINMKSPLTHSESLLPAIHFLLKSKRLNIKDVDGYALSVGPGSFTGIRIGLSTVKSFSWASGKPIAPVSTLEALALKLGDSHRRLMAPLLDAKKGEIYGSLFESRGKKLKEVVPQGAYSPDRFFSLLPAHRIIHFIGSGVEAYKDKIFHYFKDKARISSRSHFIAYEIGLLGYGIFKKGEGKDFLKIEPLYFRKSQAEERD